MSQYDNTPSADELYHYGVLGMKWGVHRATRKTAANERLRKKAAKYDVKSAKLAKKSNQIHRDVDLDGAKRRIVEADRLEVKAAKLAKRANATDNSYKQARLQSKSEKAKYNASKKRIDSNRLNKATGYGAKAMKYSVKSDKAAKKAEKARLKLAKNELYTERMRRKISALSKEEINGAYSFVKDFDRS